VRKKPFEVFEDLKVRKSSEIFLASSGSFRRWRGIHSAHGTRGRIPVVLGAILEPPSGEAKRGGVQTISDGG